MKAIAILWNSMENYFNDAISDIGAFCGIDDIIKINFDNNFASFITDIYPYVGKDKWKLEYKINIMNNRYTRNEVVILFLNIPHSKKVYCERKKTYVYENVEKLKQFIRNKYKNLVIDYSFDNIFHMTDDELEYEKTLLIIKKHFLVNLINSSHGFVHLDNYLIGPKNPIKKSELNGKRDKFWFAGNLFMYKTIKEDSYEVYAELFADAIAKILGIESAFYIPTEYHNSRGNITLNFINKNEIFIDGSHIINFYLTGSNEKNDTMSMEIICQYNNFEALPTIIENFCIKNNLHYDVNIIIGLKKMFVFDMILLQTDRHPNNWGILINRKSNVVKLAPMYDNSSIMGMNKNITKIIKSKLNDIYNFPTMMVPTSQNSFFDYKLNLVENVDDEELISIFSEYLNLLKSINIDLIFTNIQNLNNITIPLNFKLKIKELLYANIDNLSFIMAKKNKNKRK